VTRKQPQAIPKEEKEMTIRSFRLNLLIGAGLMASASLAYSADITHIAKRDVYRDSQATVSAVSTPADATVAAAAMLQREDLQQMSASLNAGVVQNVVANVRAGLNAGVVQNVVANVRAGLNAGVVQNVVANVRAGLNAGVVQNVMANVRANALAN
jgi:hypothetical protein